MGSTVRFTPALRFRSLTGFYDTVVSRLLPEQRFREALLLQADLRPGLRVLDFGAGTGTLTLLAKEKCPSSQIIGVDVDEAILERARRKREQRGLSVEYRLLSTNDLPFPPNHFDRILSCLVFHHLTNAVKMNSLREIRRVLKPTGELHVADLGKPANWRQGCGFFWTQLLDGFDTTEAHASGTFPNIVAAAGFRIVETSQFLTTFGSLRLLRCEPHA